ncbi:uncharacterized protein MYCFIDRAFT_171508 [Pseudocercospora fijiensis CIRAD86]|uniref:Uncharacterized protein n=1 Tax=Pseudocercospora fijiensis (strain CIRAD86) TaxID=383855 RepID=M2Z747_PSEFD|nr:uncharacterized protein MYCFIDRAFT_171508 [Pseudocercospora fijiensis CIRAD86]EME85610.1 hypothetical protein MYCFIDRAFT_171508 [Pseudocercospora fijiensis CIRAD86]
MCEMERAERTLVDRSALLRPSELYNVRAGENEQCQTGKSKFSSLRPITSPRQCFPQLQRDLHFLTSDTNYSVRKMAKEGEDYVVPDVGETIRAIIDQRKGLVDAKAQTAFFRKIFKDNNPDLPGDAATRGYKKFRDKLRNVVQAKCPPRFKREKIRLKPPQVDDLFRRGGTIFSKEYQEELGIDSKNESAEEEETEDEEESEEDAEPTQAASRKRKASSDGTQAEKRSRPVPKIAPVHAPARPSEIVPAADQNCVTMYMDRIKHEVETATLEYFQEHGIDAEAQSEFVLKPDQELESLYRLLFGEEWQMHVADLPDRGVLVRQDYLVMGLIGAAIHKDVLRATLPWDVEAKFHDALGADERYMATVVDDLGHTLESVLKYTAGKQILDEEFQNTQVAQHAKSLVGTLALALQPHLRRLTRQERMAGAGRPLQAQRWYRHIERAYKAAIIIKQLTSSSELGPFGFAFVKHGVALGEERHASLFEVENARSVLHFVVSGVVRKPRDEKLQQMLSEAPLASHRAETRAISANEADRWADTLLKLSRQESRPQ